MKKLEIIADELFNKIRGRYPKVTLGDSESTIVNDPKSARFFEFEVAPDRKVNITLDEEALTMLFNNNLFSEDESIQRKGWFGFMKELRQFARKRMLTFDTRDITKSNLDKRDFAYLSKEKSGDKQMSESKMYGTSQTSYQNVGNARLVVKHSEPIGETGNRNSKINAIYIESGQGEKFKYPFKHMNGARAAATHVSEGGNLYDDIGKHIVSLSEELSKLRKFKTYMNRSNVMAEGLGGYLDVVNTRIDTVKETVAKLQRPNYYKTFVENFAPNATEEVPEDVQTDWIDQLTIKQFNEELKGVFPYIYKLVSEANAVKELGPEDLLGEAEDDNKQDNGSDKMDVTDADKKANTPAYKRMKSGDKRYNDKTTKESLDEIDSAFEEMMGQFSEYACEDCGNLNWTTLGMTEEEIEEGEKHGNSKIYDKCWKGYSKVKGKKAGEPGSCKKNEGEEITNEVEVSDEMRGKISDWIDKFSKYTGCNGDTLPEGYMQWALNSGIATDFYNEDEVEAFNKMKGYPADSNDGEWQDGDHDDFTGNESGASPITTACLVELNKITGDDFIEDNAHIIDAVMHGDGNEGNAYSGAVAKAKMNGKKKGDEIDGPDGEKITLEKDQKTPLGEFILSYFDRETGQFPKGETAVLTMVEKDYGDEYVVPASKFIESIFKTYEAFGTSEAPIEQEEASDLERIRDLAGL